MEWARITVVKLETQICIIPYLNRFISCTSAYAFALKYEFIIRTISEFTKEVSLVGDLMHTRQQTHHSNRNARHIYQSIGHLPPRQGMSVHIIVLMVAVAA